ncbi:MAG: hypothetical protein K2K55_07690 [Duncaniella sp.]|nr:hypothetical protein [Duncaniella sp.]
MSTGLFHQIRLSDTASLRGLCSGVVFMLMFAVSLTVSASEIADSAEVFFRQSKTVLLPDFGGNGERLDSLVSSIRRSASLGTLKEVRVEGAASPEGSESFNMWLSEERADNIFKYIAERVELPDSLTKFSYLGRDWRGLYNRVERNTRVPYRADVLAMLENGECLPRKDLPPTATRCLLRSRLFTEVNRMLSYITTYFRGCACRD